MANERNDRPVSRYGIHVFDRRTMREYLPQDVYEHLCEVMEGGTKLEEGHAGVVAAAMKEWAVSQGATHYSHWFHPRTELTAEKHMAFLSLDSHGLPLETFGASELIQSEPDASSFPSGGARSTFEARGYTAWDPTSPAFVMPGETGGTLCIPSVFISYDGTPLDMKTPLLKALHALETRALRLARLFGNRGVRWVRMTAGAEQEYFLIDAERARQRPDLLLCGHTLQGGTPPKGQQLEDHYFGAIPQRALAYMEDVGDEAARLGIVLKTRHNEVAPAQFEFAPLHSEANLACDQNQILMIVMKRLAGRHGLRVLLHEKPFAGLNGSGKHLNVSLMDSEGRNLLSPSNQSRRNIQFLTVVCALLLGIEKYGGLLRASIATPGNMHRLGGNEAPPAIMSVFLGETLSQILDRIEKGEPADLAGRGTMELGLTRLPAIKVDNTDRNRTAPIAFTGNKFEFRAPGSSQALSGPLSMLAALWAWGIERMAERIEARLDGKIDVADAALEAIRWAAAESAPVRFDGNCYAEEWQEEAARRGLPVARTTPEALDLFLEKESRKLLDDLGVFTERELEAYHETRLEQYVKTLEIEMAALEAMVHEGILPALTRQISLEADATAKARAALGRDLPDLAAPLERACALKAEILRGAATLRGLRERAEAMELEERSRFVTEEGLAALRSLRSACDAAEELVAREFWPYPRVRELLSPG
jgi:glutamine synthetase